MTRQIVACIFARGGSKGVPRKNVRLLAKKPLIAYAIQAALQSSLINRVIVSTDDEDIARVAKEWGGEVPFIRPGELAYDDSPEWMAWQHAIRWLQEEEGGGGIEVFVCVPPTAPLRSVHDIDDCIRMLLQDQVDLVYTVKPAERNPYFNMVEMDTEGCVRLVMAGNKVMHRRQDAPVVYDSATVAYVAWPEFVLEYDSMFEGRVKAVVVPTERALDIDTELDFRIAEFLLDEQGKG